MSMSNDDRAAIDQLFGRLADTERRSPPRDAEAEAFIRDHVGRQSGAAYFMAQTIVVQDHALKDAERRIADLEARLAARDQPGSAYPSGFGASPQSVAPPSVAQGGPWSQPQPAAVGNWPQNPAPPVAPQAAPFGGGGFLAGAAQTAMGIAGGVLLSHAIGSMFSGFGGFGGGERVVEEPTIVKEDVTVEDPQQSTADAAPADDGGGFFDSFFGGGDDDTV